MTDSFVFYKSFYNAIKLLSDDSERWQVCNALFTLAFTDTEIDLSEYSDSVKIIYYVACEQVKASIQHKLDGAKGGRPRKDSGVKTPLLTQVNTNANVNVNVNDNVNANVNNPVELQMSKPQANYSKKVFNLFHNAGLPCARNNEISFLQTDFNNALSYIHSNDQLRGFTSDDIIGAVENYISVLQDPTTWVTSKMNFYTLVKSKLFYNLLPSNFVAENYKKDDTETQAPQVQEVTTYIKNACPECHKKTVIYSNSLSKYICQSCQKSYEFDDIYGGEV